jgi:hypothetical protein
VLALAGVLGASRGPGCRILRGLCSAVLAIPRIGGGAGSSAPPPDRGGPAARLQFWSASVSALRPGAALNVKLPALHAVLCHSWCKIKLLKSGRSQFLGMRPIWLKPPRKLAGFEVESAGSMLLS